MLHGFHSNYQKHNRLLNVMIIQVTLHAGASALVLGHLLPPRTVIDKIPRLGGVLREITKPFPQLHNFMLAAETSLDYVHNVRKGVP